MIDFSSETYANILQSMLDRIPETYDKRDTSPIVTALSPAAYALEGFYITLNQMQKQAFVQTASGQPLDYLATLGGLIRFPASPSVRLGVFNAAVPIGSRFSTINNENSINFIVTAEANETNQYQLTAETAGAVGNEYTGPILPISTIQGLTSAQITDILIPGDDEETDEELRTRLISALNEPSFAGNIASYREKVLSIDGVGAVQVHPALYNDGTLRLSILGADFLPASNTLVNTVQEIIDPMVNQGYGLGFAPILATAIVMKPTSLSVNVSANLSLDRGYTISMIQEEVEDKINNYLLSVRKSWGENTDPTAVSYMANVYLARVTAEILNVAHIRNVTNLKLNNQASDLILTETEFTQQVPILGTVTLSAV